MTRCERQDETGDTTGHEQDRTKQDRTSVIMPGLTKCAHPHPMYWLSEAIDKPGQDNTCLLDR